MKWMLFRLMSPLLMIQNHLMSMVVHPHDPLQQ